MIGSVAYNEAGVVGVITGCEYKDVIDEQIQYHRGNPKRNEDGSKVIIKTEAKKRVAYIGRGLDGQPWRAECATPLTRVQKQALGA